MINQNKIKLLTPGGILKKERLQKNIKIEDVVNAIKIRKDYINYLENNEFDKFESSIYVKGFLKLYSKYLNINEEKIIALYRRYMNIPPESQKVNVFPQNVNVPRLLVTPQLVVVTLAVLIVVSIIGYLVFQYYKYQKPPNVIVTDPSSESISVDQDSYTIVGYTEDGVSIAINNENIPINTDDTFSYEVKLKNGSNLVVISGKYSDNIGKEYKREIYIDYVDSSLDVDNEENENENDTDDLESEIIVEPTIHTVKVQIDGVSSWINIHADDEEVLDSVLQDGTEKLVNFETTMEITIGKLESTSVYIDSELYEITSNANGIGYLVCTVSSGDVVCE